MAENTLLRIISQVHGACMVGKGMSSPITIIKERPIGPIDTTTTRAAYGTHTIIDTDTIHTLTAIIGTPIPTMAVTGGPGSLF